MKACSPRLPRATTVAWTLAILATLACLPPDTALAKSRPNPSPLPGHPPPPPPASSTNAPSPAPPTSAGDGPSAPASSVLTGDDRRTTRLKPTGVAIDPSGSYLVADADAGAVSLFDAARRQFHRWDRFGPHLLKSPVAVARRDNDCFVADSTLGAVFAFTPEGRLLWAVTNGLERPSGLALLGRSLCVAEAGAHRISVFDDHGQRTARFGHRGIEPGEFNFPTHLAATPDGRLVVTDAMNARVQILEPDGRPVKCIGSRGDGSGHFNRPKGVAVDGFGHIYVVDALFDNVQVFDAEGRFLLHFGANGRAPGEFWMPGGIAAGADHQLLVADTYNRRLQVFRYVADR